jgi:hypothetical protein
MAGYVTLPWIHQVFALMKRWNLGIYHELRPKHVDTYLNFSMADVRRKWFGPSDHV